MGQTPEELRRDIARTREDMGSTLEALGDHVSPGRMFERRKNRMANSWSSMRDRVMGTASDMAQSVTGTVSDTTGNATDSVRHAPEAVARQTQGSPLAAGAVAFGVGFLVAAIFPPTSSEQRVATQLMDKAEPLKEELKSAGQDVVQELKEPAREAVETVKETAAMHADQVKTTAQEQLHESVETAKGTS